MFKIKIKTLNSKFKIVPVTHHDTCWVKNTDITPQQYTVIPTYWKTPYNGLDWSLSSDQGNTYVILVHTTPELSPANIFGNFLNSHAMTTYDCTTQYTHTNRNELLTFFTSISAEL